MLFPDHFLSVPATVEAGREDECNRWYNSEHIPDLVSMFPGCLEAWRCTVMAADGSQQYAALYALRTAEELRVVIDSSEIEEPIRRDDEAKGSFGARARTAHTQLFHYENATLLVPAYRAARSKDDPLLPPVELLAQSMNEPIAFDPIAPRRRTFADGAKLA